MKQFQYFPHHMDRNSLRCFPVFKVISIKPGFGKFNIPVTEICPGKIIYPLNGFIEFVFSIRLVSFFNGAA